MLIVPCLLAHRTVLWSARTHGTATLRWAAGDPESRTQGVRAASPFRSIRESWRMLRWCIGGVLLMDAFLVVISFLIGQDFGNTAMVVTTVLCSLPNLAAWLLCSWRARIADRRNGLLSAVLYREV